MLKETTPMQLRKDLRKVAEQKLKAEWDRGSSQDNQGTNNQSTGSNHGGSSPFTIPFDAITLPTDIASMLMNMAASAYQGQPSQNRQGEDVNMNG
ncbi:hypothetical protein F3Y22_tig00112236pilonHSYRG00094 [Hibiscus syriacus]|uniref:Uncharacterized protein n=1 Tax=Hibiscus syriacus TaxID=106335 RepID=A0A6A2X3Z3_HIBSY|nr:hypothetical protein F3Y22_tig00112236pilonHSYRG00094 [Hibiscus syriacus]